MNCFDCASLGHSTDAVAVCADCGAALCHDHAHVSAHWLTRTAVINRTVIVEPPARTDPLRCVPGSSRRRAYRALRGHRMSTASPKE